MPLTEAAIHAAKPSEKAVKYSDGGGLYLLVTPNGGRWWRFVYRFGGRQNSLSFGVFPGVSLRRARAKRDAALKQLAAGIDPGEARREARRAGDWRTLQSLLR
jgi:hypothetical protein